MNIEETTLNLISSATGIAKEELQKYRTEKNHWNSLQHVEIIFALEEEFGITFSQDELAKLVTVQGILDCLTGKLQ